MSETNFNETVSALFKGMDSFITAKTVVGDAVRFDDGTIILPLVDVSFGVGAGAYSGTGKNSAGGGLGGKMSPNSVLVIQDGKTRLVTVKDQDAISKVMNAVPEIIDMFKKGKSDKAKEKEMQKKGEDFLNQSAAE